MKFHIPSNSIAWHLGRLVASGLMGGFFLWLPWMSLAQTAPANQAAAPDARHQLKQTIQRLERGDTAAALPVLEQLAQQFQAKGEVGNQAEALRAMGDAYANQGEVFASLATERYQQAVQLFQQAAVPGSTSGLNAAAAAAYNAQLTLAKLGDLYLQMGKYEDAERYYNQIAPNKPKIDVLDTQYQARQKANTLKSKPGTTKNRAEGTARRLGGLFSRRPSLDTPGRVASEVEGAKGNAVEAVETVTGLVEDLHRANLLLKGFILSDITVGRTNLLRHNDSAAQERFDSALSFATRYPPIFGKSAAAKRFQIVAQTDLGDLALEQQRYADAAKHYENARIRAREAQRLDLSWPAARGVGRTQWAIAQAAMNNAAEAARFNSARDAALAAYREAVGVIEELRGRSIRGDEARQSFSAQTADVYAELTEMLAALAVGAAGNSSQPLQGEALQFASEAFTSSERARSRALLDLMGELSAEIPLGFDPALVQKRQDLSLRQTQLSDQLLGFGQPGRDSESLNDELVEAEIDRLSVESAKLEAEMRSANSSYAALTAPAVLTLAEAQTQLLDAGTVLLSYWLGEPRSYLGVISKTSVWLQPLESETALSTAVSKLRELLIASSRTRGAMAEGVASAAAGAKAAVAGVKPAATAVTQGRKSTLPASRTRDLKTVTDSKPALRPLKEDPAAREYAIAAQQLYQSLLAPAASAIQGKRLLIARAGVLNTIPFEALVTTLPAGAGAAVADFANLAYLVRGHEIVSTPSATVLAAIRKERAGKPAGRGALIIGDPIFEPTDSRLKSAQPAAEASLPRDLLVKMFAPGSEVPPPSAEAGNAPAVAASPAASAGKIPRLPATRTEASRIAQTITQSGAPADVLLDQQASEAELLRRDLRPYRFLHLATHGLLNAERPQFSGLLLSLVGNSAGHDGFLRTQEVFNLRLNSPLVMLSACKTGLGRERKGEGLVGLARAFHYAGAATVGVSLWPVDDDSTAALMTGFYARLLPPKTEKSAQERSVSGAMRAVQLSMIDERRYSAPFFWAPFVLVGDYRWEP
ncbi:MAG: CHAT domain-containing protein [Acidobacteria bacterium]|nr:CHAT domain-containing protein [Acidobacteriota bacterium]MCI0626668.1 CHAT domain-containing protein [Acidobacteriota bacterium]MCI0722493.1 CHAT domain-containing protein [Acidobacteriota bacterium]